MGIESAISKIINSGTPPTTVSTPTMASSGFPGMTPPAPPAPAQAAASGGGGMSAAMPLMGAGLGYMAGGPRGALAGGLETGLAASGNPGAAMLAPMAMQAMGMGGGQQPQGPPPMQPPPQHPQMQGGGIPQPNAPVPGPMMARQEPPTTGVPGAPRLNPQVMAALGLG